MRYSLRSLMIVVTLICVALAGRVEYLRRMAAYHQQEAKRIDLAVIHRLMLDVQKSDRSNSTHTGFGFRTAAEEVRASDYHQEMTRRFSEAVYRPWALVDESDHEATIQ